MKRRSLLKGIAAAPLVAAIPAIGLAADLERDPGWKMIARVKDPKGYSQWVVKKFLAVPVGDQYRALSEEHRYIAIHPVHDDLDVTDDIERWKEFLPHLADAPEYYQFSNT